MCWKTGKINKVFKGLKPTPEKLLFNLSSLPLLLTERTTINLRVKRQVFCIQQCLKSLDVFKIPQISDGFAHVYTPPHTHQTLHATNTLRYLISICIYSYYSGSSNIQLQHLAPYLVILFFTTVTRFLPGSFTYFFLHFPILLISFPLFLSHFHDYFPLSEVAPLLFGNTMSILCT